VRKLIEGLRLEIASAEEARERLGERLQLKGATGVNF
jgi:hypothetical protein